MSLRKLQTCAAFNFWKAKGAEKRKSFVFADTQKVSVAYELTAAQSGHVCHFARVVHMNDSLSLFLCPRVCLSHTK